MARTWLDCPKCEELVPEFYICDTCQFCETCCACEKENKKSQQEQDADEQLYNL